MTTHKLMVCPECNGAGGHTETLDPSTRQQVGVRCEECCGGTGRVLATENTLPATVDSPEFVALVYGIDEAGVDGPMRLLRYCDSMLREHLAAMYVLARQEGYDQAIQERDEAAGID